MSVKALSQALDLRGVSPSEKLLLMVLANYADERGRCFPSHRRLAEETGLTPRSVLNLLKSLEASGHITRTQRTRADGSRSSDLIALHFAGAERTEGGTEMISAPPENHDISGTETVSGGTEMISGGVRKQFPGGTETVSGLTTFEPSLNRQLEDNPPTPPLGAFSTSEDFEGAWEAYPESGRATSSRQRSWRAWEAAASTADPKRLLAAVRRFSESDAVTGPKATKPPAFHVWLKTSRYDAFLPSSSPPDPGRRSKAFDLDELRALIHGSAETQRARAAR